MYRFSGGYYDFKDDGSLSDAHYYIADYMGNNRMVVNGTTGTVEQINHYYPYGPRSNKEGLIILREKTNPLGEGGIIAESTGGEVQAFKFEDKELDRTYDLDWYDIQAF